MTTKEQITDAIEAAATEQDHLDARYEEAYAALAAATERLRALLTEQAGLPATYAQAARRDDAAGMKVLNLRRQELLIDAQVARIVEQRARVQLAEIVARIAAADPAFIECPRRIEEAAAAEQEAMAAMQAAIAARDTARHELRSAQMTRDAKRGALREARRVLDEMLAKQTIPVWEQ
jgi:chromosome segregation ATPase